MYAIRSYYDAGDDAVIEFHRFAQGFQVRAGAAVERTDEFGEAAVVDQANRAVPRVGFQKAPILEVAPIRHALGSFRLGGRLV